MFHVVEAMRIDPGYKLIYLQGGLFLFIFQDPNYFNRNLHLNNNKNALNNINKIYIKL